MATKRSLAEYLKLDYPFNAVAVADPDSDYVIYFPDLRGCMTQVESIAEVGQAAGEIKELWLETEYERGANIPFPSVPTEYSGKFYLRLPKSLHRKLAEQAELEGISLNQYVVSLLAERNAEAQLLTILTILTHARNEAAVSPGLVRPAINGAQSDSNKHEPETDPSKTASERTAA